MGAYYYEALVFWKCLEEALVPLGMTLTQVISNQDYTVRC